MNQPVNQSENLWRLRDKAGMSQRELARRTGIAQARLSRAENGEVELSGGDIRLMAIALGVPLEDKPSRGEVLERVAKQVRRAYVCPRCRLRVFLRDEDPAPAHCPEHGPMEWQSNRPYKGEPTPCHPDDLRYAGVDPERLAERVREMQGRLR